jgi:hypothetical protein
MATTPLVSPVDLDAPVLVTKDEPRVPAATPEPPRALPHVTRSPRRA